MLFNSVEFLLFFPVVTLCFFILPHRFRWALLLLASCVFYMAFVPVYILILAFTILIDYFAGIWIENAQGRKRKLLLVLSIVANVGVLAIFKYYNFFIENINTLLQFSGTHSQFVIMNIILPIGLSFHTFQAMSYTIEVYKGRQKAERHFGIYALYVMFYPQLVAGPIERPQNLLHQFKEKRLFSAVNLHQGLRLMLWGLFKKAVIADRLSLYVNEVFAHQTEYSSLNLAMAAAFFSIQIYCDFSGYSDIAIGAAKTMGFDLMTNFNRPYFATNIRDFWSRWHISLSTWFRDYVYISLGGNRVSMPRVYFNTAIVFLVSGFWHGANWTFIVWGAIHTVLIIGYMLYVQFMKGEGATRKVLIPFEWLSTFVAVTLAWVFFRAESLPKALLFLEGIFRLDSAHAFVNTVPGFGEQSIYVALSMIGIMFCVEAVTEPKMRNMDKSLWFDIAIGIVALSCIVYFGVFNRNSFIYFQF